MNIHFIAIGGSAMHNLAIALKQQGHKITGSDDEIYEPAKSRLQAHQLFPKKLGWYKENIHDALDAVILGMHARLDNEELQAARAMGLKIYSYPEYIYEQSKNKQRIVVAGSHGKTSITAMVLHVLNFYNYKFDYLVGAQLNGFENMVQITDAPIIVIEGDEYLSSAIDLKPKFHHYRPHIALISGIAWDHINVFPSFEDYQQQFKIFVELIEKGGTLIYFSEDKILQNIAKNQSNSISVIPYKTPLYKINDGITYIINQNQEIPLQVFGEHNLQNIEGARNICNTIGISTEDFYKAISSFSGAAKRLQKIASNDKTIVFKDFAHAPSKLKATIRAVKTQYPNKYVIACMELHTFSSLNKAFLPEYKNSMIEADKAYVYFNPKTIAHKKLATISEGDIYEAFGTKNLEVYTNSHELFENLKQQRLDGSVLLIMTSGNFDGWNIDELAKEIVNST